MRTLLVALLICGVVGDLPNWKIPGTLLVVNKDDHVLSFVDTETLQIYANVQTGFTPHEVAASPDGSRAYVANYGTGSQAGSSVTVVDVQQARVITTVELRFEGRLQTRPHGIVVAPNGNVFVTCEGTATLVVINQNHQVIAAWPTNSRTSHMVALAPRVGLAFIANLGSADTTIINTATGQIRAHVGTGAGTEGITVNTAETFAFATARDANRLAKVSVVMPGVVQMAATAAMPIRAWLTPDDRIVLVTCALAGVLQAFHSGTLEILHQVTIGGMPVGVVTDSRGQFAYVARTLDRRVSVVDLNTWRVVGEINAGNNPDGMAFVAPRGALGFANRTTA